MRVELDNGRVIDLGVTETSPSIGITDYSRRVTDDFGVTTVVERGFARRMSVKMMVPFDGVDRLQRQLADLRATPARWVADDRFSSLSFRGFYKDFDLDLAVPPVSYCTMTVEGLAATGPVADAGGDPAPVGLESTLLLLQPLAITDSQLVASSVPEADYAEWSQTTTYAVGAHVIKAATHRIYECIAANIGSDPSGDGGKWIDFAPTNRWAMFDQALGTSTEADGQIVVTIATGDSDAVALLDIVGAAVRVQALGFDRSIAVDAGPVVMRDLPGGAVTVTISGAGLVSVGTLLAGSIASLGVTEASPSAGITDYSRKEVDDFGEVTISQRAWAKRMTARALIRTDAVDVVASRIAAVRARPSLWIGQTGLDSLTIYGFFKDFGIDVGEDVSKLSVSIEGLSRAAKVEPLKTSVSWPEIIDNDPQHPKPADGADVTGDNTSKDTDAVNGRPAATVTSSLDINALGYIAAGLRQDDYERAVEGRTYIAGQPVTTYLLEFRNSQTSINSAINSTFTLLGAKTADGTGWVLNLQTVQVGGGKTLAQRLSEIGVSNGTVTASIQRLEEVTADLKGKVNASVTLTLTANGYVSGYRLTNDGTTSAMTIVADQFAIVSDNNGTPITPFRISAGTVFMDRLTATTISYDSLVQRFTDVGQQNLDPNGWYQVLPGGMIMQGGKLRRSIAGDGPVAVTFPRPFPNQVLATGANAFLSGANYRGDFIIQNLNEATLSGTTFYAQATKSDVRPIQGIDWWAWGK